MTEVRACSEGSVGLFATRQYAVGDVVLHESAPLATLTSGSATVDNTCLMALHRSASKKKRAKLSSLSTAWSDLKVPSSVPREQAGNFRGMVQAVVSYAKLRTPEMESKLLELYHPSLSTTAQDEERVIVEASKEALKFLQKNATEGSALKNFVKEQPENAMKAMLVYSCNAFEGGRLYERQSRINHSCNPNAIVQPSNENGQSIRAAAPISVGEEITISYLGLFLYTDGRVRREQLKRSKHFLCSCERCREGADTAAAIPCPSCHKRHGRYMDEDTQYDDEGSVRYAVPTDSTVSSVECSSCRETTTAPPGDSSPNHVLQLTRTVSKKVAAHLNEQGGVSGMDESAVQEELEEQLQQLASTVVGARHWATNLMLLVRLDRTLKAQHANMLSNGEVPDLTEVAECIDSLERLVQFVEGLQLRLHMGHVLSNAVVGVARTLVSLGDTKSKKYAAEWLDKIKDYVDKFESDGMKKVVSTLAVAWQKEEGNDDMAMASAQDEGISNKRVKLS